MPESQRIKGLTCDRRRQILFRMVVLIILGTDTNSNNNNHLVVHGFQQPNRMMNKYQHNPMMKNRRIRRSQNNHKSQTSKRPYTSRTTRSALTNPRNADSLVFGRRQNLREAISSTATGTTPITQTSKSTPNNVASGPLGFLIGVTVIVVLGLSTSDTSFYGFSIDQNGVDELNEVAFATATNILDASVPTSSSDYFAIALGESIGGVIGATLSVLITFILQMNMNNNQQDQQDETKDMPTMSRPFVSQALADSDYFIANSATYTLLEAVGVPPEIAKLSSVFIAAVPSQLVKLGPVLQERRSQEEILLQQLLEEQNQETLTKSRSINSFGPFRFSTSTPKRENVITSVDPSELIPVVGTIGLDFVEVFADVTRWLEYE
jgi:hypothetical protein